MATPLIQQDPGLQRRKDLALAMLQAGQQSTPVQHWTQGANRIAQALLGAYNLKQAQQEEAQQQQLGNEVVQQAIGEMNTPSQPVMTGEGGTQYDMGAPQSREPMQRFAEVLAGSPYTQEFGTNMMLQNMLNQQKLKQASKTGQQKLGQQMALEEYKAQLRQKYPKPESEFDKYLKTLQAEKTKTDIEKRQRELEEQERAKTEEGETLEATLDAAKNLVAHPGFNRIFGSVAGATYDVSQEAINANALRESLLAKLVLAKRGALKGQGSISNTESTMIENAASMLQNRRIDPELARQETIRVIEYLQRKKNAQSGEKKPAETKTENQGTIPTPKTQAEFDALKKGDFYIDPEDGLKYRKI